VKPSILLAKGKKLSVFKKKLSKKPQGYLVPANAKPPLQKQMEVKGQTAVIRHRSTTQRSILVNQQGHIGTMGGSYGVMQSEICASFRPEDHEEVLAQSIGRTTTETNQIFNLQ
jgi:hypothetical protein